MTYLFESVVFSSTMTKTHYSNKDRLITKIIIQTNKEWIHFWPCGVIRHIITIKQLLHWIFEAVRNLSLIQNVMKCVWYKWMLQWLGSITKGRVKEYKYTVCTTDGLYSSMQNQTGAAQLFHIFFCTVGSLINCLCCQLRASTGT